MNPQETASPASVPQIHIDGDVIPVIPDDVHEWTLPTNLVSQGFGVQQSTIRKHKHEHDDELLKDKHWVVTIRNTPGGPQEATYWTKRGVIRLGFFIRSDRAKKFRDLAEDLVLRHLDGAPANSRVAGMVFDGRKVPTNFREAIQELAVEAEKTEKLTGAVAALTREVDDLRPDAEYGRRVGDSPSLYSTTQIAKDLGMTANALYKDLREKGVLWKTGKLWVPKAGFDNQALHKLVTVTIGDEGRIATKQYMKWTERGRRFILLLMDGRGLKAKSALRELAAIMPLQPQIPALRIEGYPDRTPSSSGSGDFEAFRRNLAKLSPQAAGRVIDFLINLYGTD